MSTHELKPSIGGALGRIHRLWRQAITSAVSPLELTESRWAVMVHLDHLGDGCSQTALATALAIEMPSLTRTLNQLEDQNLIERRISPNDRRAHTLWFTENGRLVMNDLEERIQAVRTAIYGNVDDEQLDQLAAVVCAMESNLHQYLNTRRGA
ncbi:MarR family transcriptional regulator [Marinobacter salinexigens]|uniref:MarR family transcriptional regulator n=1 Tax=Marinobacter salinexigens TaxID=2919747 RepID=A0A5B0VPL2_9GAMM|nr:MarR family transcriptional regulator [Marinobacter salinexigens]KAA1176135.1 MarR family transcriptional regulator [Marinobacter salinexigens]